MRCCGVIKELDDILLKDLMYIIFLLVIVILCLCRTELIKTVFMELSGDLELPTDSV